jgi:hypothetical protein
MTQIFRGLVGSLAVCSPLMLAAQADFPRVPEPIRVDLPRDLDGDDVEEN